jgi:hypothetical protein
MDARPLHPHRGVTELTYVADLIRKDVIPGPGTYRPKMEDAERIPMWTYLILIIKAET